MHNDFSFLNLEELTKDEWKQRLKPIDYPKRLLELGGLLEILEEFQNDYFYEFSSDISDNSKLEADEIKHLSIP